MFLSPYTRKTTLRQALLCLSSTSKIDLCLSDNQNQNDPLDTEMTETFRVRSSQLLYLSLLQTIIEMPEQVKYRLLLKM